MKAWESERAHPFDLPLTLCSEKEMSLNSTGTPICSQIFLMCWSEVHCERLQDLGQRAPSAEKECSTHPMHVAEVQSRHGVTSSAVSRTMSDGSGTRVTRQSTGGLRRQANVGRKRREDRLQRSLPGQLPDFKPLPVTSAGRASLSPRLTLSSHRREG